MSLENKKYIEKNSFSLFAVTLSIYLPQGLFFVGMAGYFSQMSDPLISLGNVFLLAMIPFVAVVFFLASRIDVISTSKQLYIIKASRTLVLGLLSVGILLGGKPPILIYVTILVYDLGFFLYQSTSARMSKYISKSDCLKRTESITLLGSQLGMAVGGILAGFLLANLTLGELFALAAILEGLGLLGVIGYKESELIHRKISQHKNKMTDTIKVIKLHLKSPDIFLSLFIYALLLPLQQLLNLISGPWSEWKFNDMGQMLGWLVGGIAIGACAASLCLIVFNKLRDLEWLKLSPMIGSISILGIYYSFSLSIMLLFSIIFGFSFTVARVFIRAAFVNKINIDSVNSATMVATMLSVVLSVLVIVFVSYVVSLGYFQIFIFIACIGFLQFLLLNFGEKLIGWLPYRKGVV